MFKSTTDIKKKRPCHTNGHKNPLKGSKVLQGGDIGNYRIRRHLPRYQTHISTQTDSIQIKSQEVKGYSGKKKKLFIVILKKILQFSLCCQNTWATGENCGKGMYKTFVKHFSLNMNCVFLDKK